MTFIARKKCYHTSSFPSSLGMCCLLTPWILVEMVVIVKDISDFVMEDLLVVTGLWDLSWESKASIKKRIWITVGRHREMLSFGKRCVQLREEMQSRDPTGFSVWLVFPARCRCFPEQFTSTFSTSSVSQMVLLSSNSQLFKILNCHEKTCPSKRRREKEIEQSLELYLKSFGGLVVWYFLKTFWRRPMVVISCVWSEDNL